MLQSDRTDETAPAESGFDFAAQSVDRLRRELGKVLVGQQPLVDHLLVGLLTGGHILIEGVPGLAKTLAARSLAAAVGAEFHRVQFTPDLLPADLLGTEIYDQQTGRFSIRWGPIVTQMLLVDEINRASAKVQSALLEVMQERQVTIAGQTRPLAEPFLVVATQNPIEQQGTYPLAEAQIDRFLLKAIVDYPARDEEQRIVDLYARPAGVGSVDHPAGSIETVLESREVLVLREAVDRIHLAATVRNYLLDIVQALRRPKDFGLHFADYVELGPSPRGALSLALASKARALLQGRDYVVPHDVKTAAPDCLRHRLILSFDALGQGVSADSLIAAVLDSIKAP